MPMAVPSMQDKVQTLACLTLSPIQKALSQQSWTPHCPCTENATSASWPLCSCPNGCPMSSPLPQSTETQPILQVPARITPPNSGRPSLTSSSKPDPPVTQMPLLSVQHSATNFPLARESTSMFRFKSDLKRSLLVFCVRVSVPFRWVAACYALSSCSEKTCSFDLADCSSETWTWRKMSQEKQSVRKNIHIHPFQILCDQWTEKLNYWD